MGPKDILIEGCKILDAVLVPFGFVFIFRGAGHSCEVVSQFSLLQYPERLTPSETRLVEIARKRKEQ